MTQEPWPPPHYKRWTIVDYAQRAGIDTLVETGTYDGDTVGYACQFLRDVYSIELGRELYERCRLRFAGRPNVHLLQGDSAVVLPCLLHGLSRPAVLWLDAHWSDWPGGAKGPLDSAIQGELSAVAAWGREDAVVLIDDVRDLGKDGYLPIGEVRERLLSAYPGWVFYVQDDIARAHRPMGGEGGRKP
jgi:hypothetical protein